LSGAAGDPITSVMEPCAKPAGWYPDPKDVTRRRYWDGAHWAALTQPPSIAEPVTAEAPVGSPGNPIGAGSVALAAAFASLTAARFDDPQPVEPPQPPGRRRHLLRRGRS
jgi:hypothetical protein